MTEEEKKEKKAKAIEAAEEIFNEIKNEVSEFKSLRKPLRIEEKIFQMEEFLLRIDKIRNFDDGLDSKCDDLEEQIESMYETLPLPSNEEEQLACLTKLRKNHLTGDSGEPEKYMVKLARKAREQYPSNEELQAVVDKIIAPAGSSFLKKMWIENRSICIALLLLLSGILILSSLTLLGD